LQTIAKQSYQFNINRLRLILIMADEEYMYLRAIIKQLEFSSHSF